MNFAVVASLLGEAVMVELFWEEGAGWFCVWSWGGAGGWREGGDVDEGFVAGLPGDDDRAVAIGGGVAPCPVLDEEVDRSGDGAVVGSESGSGVR